MLRTQGLWAGPVGLTETSGQPRRHSSHRVTVRAGLLVTVLQKGSASRLARFRATPAALLGAPSPGAKPLRPSSWVLSLRSSRALLSGVARCFRACWQPGIIHTEPKTIKESHLALSGEQIQKGLIARACRRALSRGVSREGANLPQRRLPARPLKRPKRPPRDLQESPKRTPKETKSDASIDFPVPSVPSGPIAFRVRPREQAAHLRAARARQCLSRV